MYTLDYYGMLLVPCTCIDNSIYDSNTGIGYKFAFYYYMYDLDMTYDLQGRFNTNRKAVLHALEYLSNSLELNLQSCEQ